MKLKNEFIQLSPEQRLYNLKQPLVALTGGIASGKSSVAKIFAEHGLKVINADELVKKIYSSTEALDFIKTYSPDVVENEKINFPQLRKKVFNDSNLKESIETFIYARLPAAFTSELAADDHVIIYDVPLLFERKLESLFDQVIVVYTPREIQLKRLIQRDNSSADLADKILNQQIDIELKRTKANFVIDNQGNHQELRDQTLKLLNELFH